jgi:hypothetical protein
MSILETLTEGIVQRDMAKEGQALLNKWAQTGLLEGISDEQMLKDSLLLLSLSFVVYSPDLLLTILLVFNQCHSLVD